MARTSLSWFSFPHRPILPFPMDPTFQLFFLYTIVRVIGLILLWGWWKKVKRVKRKPSVYLQAFRLEPDKSIIPFTFQQPSTYLTVYTISLRREKSLKIWSLLVSVQIKLHRKITLGAYSSPFVV